MGPTEILADYVARASYDDFPAGVILRAKHCIQDVIGCALGGIQTETGRHYLELAREFGGKAEATVIGDGSRLSCDHAAYINTETANLLDCDDLHQISLSHLGSTAVCSALAVGESVNASGKDIITATILAHEVALRVAHAMRSIIMARSGKEEVLSNLSFTVFGPATAAGKVLKMDAAQISNVFGVVGSTPIVRGQSPVHMGGIPTQHPYTEIKYNMGTYSLLAVMGILRARKFAGIRNMLDAGQFWEQFWRGCGGNTYNTDELTKRLGKEYRILEMNFKPIPFCGQCQAPVSAVYAALKGEKLAAADVEEITLYGLPKLQHFTWETMPEAQFSTPCAVAFATVGAEPGPEWYTSGRYKEEDIRQIAGKVKFVEDPRARELSLKEGRYICAAEIKTRDGKIRKAHIEHEKGSPGNPLSEPEIKQKFLVNSRGVLGEKKATKLWDTLLGLEKIQNIQEIFKY